MNFVRDNIKVIALVSPLVAFFLLAMLIPYEQAGELESTTILPGGYLGLVIGRVVLMGVLIAAFWRIYKNEFPLSVDHWGLIVGIVGGFIWIGVCGLGLEQKLFGLFGAQDWLGGRSGANPSELYGDTGQRYLFLAFRFALLVLMVPIAEELFLRGFLMRMIDCDEWQTQPLSQIGRMGILAGTVYGVITHPSEMVAAAIWFSLVTLLMLRTGKFWNCVLAHAITNLILGIYILQAGQWHLW